MGLHSVPLSSIRTDNSIYKGNTPLDFYSNTSNNRPAAAHIPEPAGQPLEAVDNNSWDTMAAQLRLSHPNIFLAPTLCNTRVPTLRNARVPILRNTRVPTRRSVSLAAARSRALTQIGRAHV